MIPALISPDLTDGDFRRIRDLLYGVCGVKLNPGKEGLVKSRLSKRLRALNLDSFAAYLDYVDRDASGAEMTVLVDSLTTNKTSFFREPAHFEYTKQEILPRLAEDAPVRVWSAGCSSGEEPYSIALMLHEAFGGAGSRDMKVLATDISTRVLASAREGVYAEDVLQPVPNALLHRYFTRAEAGPPRLYRAGDGLKETVRFARLNLMEGWPMKGPFQVIFCRNVMIYFDKPTRQRLVDRFYELLAPGGHLFVGHSESLTGLPNRFRYVRPAIYAK